ncbi:MAG: membrane protein insertion efficiency factor YidD [Candidatus Rokubacteria bacterium]|nr:membrane protein insertion efficiency factor YidD [Candidatus Rokubacteria bacterium]
MTRLNRSAVQLVRGYQRFVSPLLPWACRFSPTCSEYARQALLLHGVAWGSWLAARRLLRCHPFHPGGYDPPPLVSAEDTRRPWKSG